MIEKYILKNNNRIYTFFSNQHTVYREEIKIDGSEDDLIVYFDMDLEPFNKEIIYPIYDNLYTIEIYQDDKLLYSGYISETEYDIDKGMVKVTIYSMLTLLSHNLYLHRYQTTCPYRLFSKECGILKDDFKVTYNDFSIDKNKITIIGGTGYNNNYFTSGFIEINGYTFYIMSDYNDVFTLSFNIDYLIDSTSELHVYPGCDKTSGTCKLKFNNYNNFGGFTEIPTENPNQEF